MKPYLNKEVIIISNYLINKEKLMNYIIKDFEDNKRSMMFEMGLQKSLFFIHYYLTYDLLKYGIDKDINVDLKTFDDNFKISQYGAIDEDILKIYNNENIYDLRKNLDLKIEIGEIFNDLNDERVDICKRSILNTLDEIRDINPLNLAYCILDLDVIRKVDDRNSNDKKIYIDDIVDEFLIN